MARVLLIRQFRFPLDIRVRREVDALLSDGHEVDIVCIRGPGEPLLGRWKSARILRVPLAQQRGGALGYLLRYGAFAAVAFLLAAILHLLRRYSLVQVNSLPDPLVFSALVPRLLGARVLLDLHETMPEFFATRFGKDRQSAAVRAVAATEQASIRFADHVTTCTEQMKEAFVRRGAPPDKIDVVLNSADESVFVPRRHRPRPADDGRFRLIIHGTVEERYGIDTTIEAIAMLADELPGLELQVYGRGSIVDELKNLAQGLGVAERVHFQPDWVPIDELVDALAQADAGVVAMKRDAFRDLTHCNKMYELVTMRRPTLMSRTYSVEKYFEEGCFAWFESGNAAELASAIRRLHDDPQWGQELVQHATRRNEPYRWAHQREHYLDVVRQLLSAKGGGREHSS